ncbi:hypothetical protein [Paenibacillus typhae]|uniref:hypothetical protein n=1 Tax=Paenibacillus typhae TaxID=1174501 RepID=UPI0039EF2C10
MSFSIIAGVEAGKALFDLALLMGKPDGEEEAGFIIFEMSPKFNKRKLRIAFFS